MQILSRMEVVGVYARPERPFLGLFFQVVSIRSAQRQKQFFASIQNVLFLPARDSRHNE